MIDDFHREQAALYALDALPADEAAKFRALARTRPELIALVADYEATGSLLAESIPDTSPPPELRGKIMQSISTKAAASAPRSRRLSSRLAWAAAAVLAFVTTGLWLQTSRLESENLALSERSAGQERTSDVLQARIADLTKRNALAAMQIATLTSKFDASYLASIAWDNSAQEGILKVRRLPAAGNGRDYQLWVIDPHNAVPVSAGVFAVAADGSATIRFSPAQHISNASAFAVSLEKTGGSTSPAGPVVLAN